MPQHMHEVETESGHPTPAHRIDIEVVGLGERGHRYRVTYEGRTLIDSCRVPGLDACRALLAMGITGKLEMWRLGKAWPDMQLDIEGGAKLTVLENENEGPRFAWWRPHPRAALRNAVSSVALSPLERAEAIPAPAAP